MKFTSSSSYRQYRQVMQFILRAFLCYCGFSNPVLLVQATALQNMVTLPKRMLPLKQQLFKSFVLNKNIPQLATSSAASSAAPSSHAATAPQPQTKSSFVDVLERPEQPSSTATAPAPKRANIPKPTGGVTLPGELVIPGVDIPARVFSVFTINNWTALLIF